jgi:DNA-binding NarL/FixJ family response regulator
MPSSGDQDLWITTEERAVLTASAMGLGVDEAAKLLGRTPEQVRRLVASAVAKLGASSKLEAVVIAIRYGLIDIPID